ncbi:hypothetical protein [Psychrobacillus sp. L3]|uniref:Cap15 family cyclic dinucleotide receptor domain-containing protein n=1 Tax=Psychrobacillus sp. L3 TaxID=3236891 RepID=UPI0036F3E67A
MLVIISISLTSFINYVFTISHIEISVIGFTIFGLVFLLFDKYLWKWGIFYKIGIIKTPNLNGTWEGTLSSSYHEFKSEMPACIVIKQTWTHIFISGIFNQSKSYSISANLDINNGARTVLRYVYLNKNNLVKSDGTMGEHSGMATLEFTLDEGELEGKYYNEPPQNVNYGVLKLQKQIKK